MRTTAAIRRLASALLPLRDGVAQTLSQASLQGEIAVDEALASLASVTPAADLATDLRASDALTEKLATIVVLARLQWPAVVPHYVDRALAWLAQTSPPWLAHVASQLRRGLARDDANWQLLAHSAAMIAEHERPHLWELLLAAWSPAHRKFRGVFFTPERLATAMVERVDQLLRDELELPGGLADTTSWSTYSQGNPHGFTGPVVRILDPAAGSGAFLLAAIARIHKSVIAEAEACGRAPLEAWNDYIDRHLLPRLAAVELFPEASAVMALRIVDLLARTGYRFTSPVGLPIVTASALEGPADDGRWLHAEPLTVILGNPPFASLSQNRGAWITQRVRDYLKFDGERLGERKTWLHDDYVKFLRLAEWCIERAGLGIVALVTSHSWLENTTFRLARRRLHHTFPRIEIADFHGNRKSGELAPQLPENLSKTLQKQPISLREQMASNENIFGLDAGIGAFFLRSRAGLAPAVRRFDYWGTVDEKLAAFEQQVQRGTPGELLHPAGSDYPFRSPKDLVSNAWYRQTPLLTEVMPLTSTAVVTARDGLVIAFTEEELLARIGMLVDERASDDELRTLLFARPRSPRYPAGDTRSFKLAAVRAALRAEVEQGIDLARYVRRCAYRPFDSRYLFWHPLLIDWPRGELMRHVIDQTNWLLVSRRQMLPGRAANFFWITDAITLDGILRSDNRGSESLFPLWRFAAGGSSKKANISSEIRDKMERLGIGGSEHGDEAACFALLYATLASSAYRQGFAESLWREFPRVIVPREADLARELTTLGRQLIDVHLLRHAAPEFTTAGEGLVTQPRYPKWSAGQVLVSAERSMACCSREVFEYRIGAHAPAQKWLADRRGRTLTRSDQSHYQQLLGALERTLEIIAQIDRAIAARGGIERAFAPE